MVDPSPAFARGLAVASLAGYDSAHVERLIHQPGFGRLFLVPYGVDDDCTRHPDLGDPKREYPGMFFAAIRLRPPAEWLSGIPTADFGSFEVSYQEAQDSLMLKWRPETLPSLSLEQVAVVYRALPTHRMLACSYRTALDSLHALIRQHPDWAARRPVREILSWWGWRPPASWEADQAPCPDTSFTKRPN